MPLSQARSTPFRIVIAGGGTGGHVIPALAIGRELHNRHGAELLFIGTQKGLETELIPAGGFPLELVRSGQLKNVSLRTRAKTLADLPHGILRCVQLLRRFQPQVVVGVGGYASGPAILAAAILRIPTLAYEPNAVPGLTNRIAGRFTSAAAVNFPQTTHFFRNAEVTGVPVRPEIFNIPPRPIPQTSPAQIPNLNSNAGAPAIDPTPLRLLVTAGSQGAAIFNDLLPRITHRLLHALPNLTIVHQSGPRHLDAPRAAYAQTGLLTPPKPTSDSSSRPEAHSAAVESPPHFASGATAPQGDRVAHSFATRKGGIDASTAPAPPAATDLPASSLFTPHSSLQIEPFLTDMPAQYAAADLILARSGSTVAEICAAGRASLLIPFPQAADDHQRHNAEVLAGAGAAAMLLQKDTTEQTLYEALHTLLTDHPRRATMAANARTLARPGALERIAAMVLRLAKR